MSIKIWHIATHTANIGDGALVNGIQTTLKQDLEEEIQFHNDCLMYYENYWGNKKYDQELVDQINEEADLLIIGGGGMMDGRRSRKHTGIGFDLPLNLFEQIKIPIVFYALGFNLFKGQFFWNKPALVKLLQFAARRKDCLFSVRNDLSQKRLQELVGVDTARCVIEIPDPGLYVETKPTHHAEFSESNPNILIQLAGDNTSARYNQSTVARLPFVSNRIAKIEKNVNLSQSRRP